MSTRGMYIKTWGCQMNTYDSQKLQSILEETGLYHTVQRPEEADILILNTCSIREKAQEKLFHQLGRWRALKASRPGCVIAVGGCVAALEGHQLRQRAPYVDILFGPQSLQRIPKLLEQLRKDNQPVVDLQSAVQEKFEAIRPDGSPGVSAYLSIMEGCNKYCSYCVVPYTRGPEVSRALADVLQEVTRLTEAGVREIVFLGQNVNAYKGKKEDGTLASLSELLERTASIPGIVRIRFVTSHPREFTSDLVTAFAKIKALAGFLHLPIQSGSDVILKRMRRGYTVDRYLSLVEDLRKARPGIWISSDFIVGFPGETEEEFLETLTLTRTLDFDISYSFLFSPRPGTPAASIPDTISLQEKQRRLARLQKTIQQQTNRHTESLLDQKLPVLVESISEEGEEWLLQGRTEHYRTVFLPGAAAHIGRLISARIHEGKGTVLRGELVDQ